jgi:hypothetical protein
MRGKYFDLCRQITAKLFNSILKNAGNVLSKMFILTSIKGTKVNTRVENARFKL